jgi:Flp pilus assembly pilin Flp
MFGLISQAVKRGSSGLAGPPKFNFTAAGATAVEYALPIALIAAVIIATVSLVAPQLLPGFVSVSAEL